MSYNGLTSGLYDIVEYRGIEALVAARVLCDDNETGEGHGYVTGDVFSVAGVAELTRTTESSNEAHYYDNMPAVVISSTGADEVTISTSAISMAVLAEITGQNYDADNDAFIEGQRSLRYFALGYKTKKTNGDQVYVWRYKGTFNVPDSTHTTENDGTDANGQEITFTGISTTHKFSTVLDDAGSPKGAKAYNINATTTSADVSHFFDTVTTPDDMAGGGTTKYTIVNSLVGCSNSNASTSIASGTEYESTITADGSLTLGTVTVYMGGVDVSSTAVTGGAIDIASVTGDIVIVAKAS